MLSGKEINAAKFWPFCLWILADIWRRKVDEFDL